MHQVLRCFVAFLGMSLILAAPGRSQTPSPSVAKVAPSTDLLDLNQATVEQLAALPGMGVVYARRIVEGRPYQSKNQLVTRGVLPRAAYEQMKDRVIAHRVAKN